MLDFGLHHTISHDTTLMDMEIVVAELIFGSPNCILSCFLGRLKPNYNWTRISLIRCSLTRSLSLSLFKLGLSELGLFKLGLAFWTRPFQTSQNRTLRILLSRHFSFERRKLLLFSAFLNIIRSDEDATRLDVEIASQIWIPDILFSHSIYLWVVSFSLFCEKVRTIWIPVLELLEKKLKSWTIS